MGKNLKFFEIMAGMGRIAKRRFMDWNREFLPWLASQPEEDQLEWTDILLRLMAAMMDRRFRGRV